MANLEQINNMPSRMRVAAILRKAILAGKFISGQELSLTKIAEQIGVSRTPVREAFQMLASEGLIELRLNKGAIVKEIGINFIKDHYEVRILLEGEATAKASLRKADMTYLLSI